MKISQKRTCNGCVAFALNICELGFNVKLDYDHLMVIKATPKEPCPKPKTIKDYIEARQKYLN